MSFKCFARAPDCECVSASESDFPAAADKTDPKLLLQLQMQRLEEQNQDEMDGWSVVGCLRLLVVHLAPDRKREGKRKEIDNSPSLPFPSLLALTKH